jgi:hypothetical protein
MTAPIQSQFESFGQPGLYLLFDDGLLLTLTREVICQIKRLALEDLSIIPSSVRANPNYAPCPVCPKSQSALICHCIPTIFPLIEHADRFLTNEDVTVIFRPERCESSEDTAILHTSRTTAQTALQYVSILNIIHYCEVGRTYFKYFAGITPFTEPLVIAERVYLSIYWNLGGDLQAVNALIAKMRHEFDITAQCQMDRLRLFCTNTAFLDAVVVTHLSTQFLDGRVEKRMRKAFQARTAPVMEPDIA